MKEYEQPTLSEGQRHLQAVLASIETVDALDLSFLLTVMRGMEYLDALKKIEIAYLDKTKNTITTDLVFSITDENIEKYWGDKKSFLRFLKALNERRGNGKTRFSKIVVKGPRGTVDIEPNVFASGIKFQEIE